jgi:hypothetical protein
MLLSFGQAFAQIYGPLTFDATVSGSIFGSPDTIANLSPVTFTVSYTYTQGPGDWKRQTWVESHEFTGTGIASVALNSDINTIVPVSHSSLFDIAYFIKAESWDGILPDRFAMAGIANNGGVPGGTADCMIFNAVITLANPDVPGEICIAIGDMDDNAYDWLFDDPQPTFDTKCWPVATAPNFPPVITNCPSQLTTQHDVDFLYDFDATDAESDPITWDASIGTIDANGVWTWNPPCDSVGKSVTLTVHANDANHNPGATCVVDLVVQNSAPELGAGCGVTKTVGISGGAIQFSSDDANSGDTEDWSVVSVVPTPAGSYNISGTGLLTFIPGPGDAGNFVFTVRVTDCAGAYDECTATFNVVLLNPFSVQIAKNEDVLQGHHSYVDVIANLNVDASEVWGFDILIGYDPSALAFMGAIAGEPWSNHVDYDYEYFTFRYNYNGNCGNGCPTGLLRVVGIADQNDGANHPVTKVLENGIVLFTLDFFVSNDRTMECMFVPIRFYWMDCGDNTFAMRFPAGANGCEEIPQAENAYDVKTVLNCGIFEFSDPLRLNNLANFAGTFPTYFGAPTIPCDTATGEKNVYRLIDFINGGIDIICSDSIDARGDVNLNGIANEIGDAVVFTNYFIAGLAAFTVNVEGQIAATEINGDGSVLTVADLVYLVRVIIGDASALDKVSPYTTTAHFGTMGSVVTVDQKLGGAYFVFDGKAEVSLADGASNADLKVGEINGNTVALVIDLDAATAFTGNILNTNGRIKSVEASDVNGNLYKTVILPSSFSVTNYPNPFNPATTIEMALPVASNWTLSIYNVAGQKVFETSGYSEAGVQQVVWNADQASGIYFYKVDAGQFSATKKMVLLK